MVATFLGYENRQVKRGAHKRQPSCGVGEESGVVAHACVRAGRFELAATELLQETLDVGADLRELLANFTAFDAIAAASFDEIQNSRSFLAQLLGRAADPFPLGRRRSGMSGGTVGRAAGCTRRTAPQLS